MKNLLKIVLCASIVLHFPLSTFHSLQAQITHGAQGRLDENASVALKKAAKKLQNLQCEVTLTLLDSQKKETSRQKASVVYRQGKYHLTMDQMELFSDGTTVWQWNKEAKEVVVSNMPPENEIDLLNPGRLIANYDKNFRAKYIRTDDDGTAVIDLQPRSSQSYHKIRLFVNETSGELKRVEVHKYDSSREIYDFAKQRYGNAKSSFVFKAEEHPGVEVIDMR